MKRQWIYLSLAIVSLSIISTQQLYARSGAVSKIGNEWHQNDMSSGTIRGGDPNVQYWVDREGIVHYTSMPANTPSYNEPVYPSQSNYLYNHYYDER